MLKKLALFGIGKLLAILTIILLNIILWFVSSENAVTTRTSMLFDLLVNIMYVSLIASSLILGWLNWMAGKRYWTLFFWANIGVVMALTMLSSLGLIKLSFATLIWLDLYWLNTYLIYLARTKPLCQ